MHQYNFEIIGSQKYNWYMDRNMLVHTGENQFKCELCTKEFNLKDRLVYHSKNVTEIGYISYMYYYI